MQFSKHSRALSSDKHSRSQRLALKRVLAHESLEPRIVFDVYSGSSAYSSNTSGYGSNYYPATYNSTNNNPPASNLNLSSFDFNWPIAEVIAAGPSRPTEPSLPNIEALSSPGPTFNPDSDPIFSAALHLAQQVKEVAINTASAKRDASIQESESNMRSVVGKANLDKVAEIEAAYAAYQADMREGNPYEAALAQAQSERDAINTAEQQIFAETLTRESTKRDNSLLTARSLQAVKLGQANSDYRTAVANAEEERSLLISQLSLGIPSGAPADIESSLRASHVSQGDQLRTRLLADAKLALERSSADIHFDFVVEELKILKDFDDVIRTARERLSTNISLASHQVEIAKIRRDGFDESSRESIAKMVRETRVANANKVYAHAEADATFDAALAAASAEKEFSIAKVQAEEAYAVTVSTLLIAAVRRWDESLSTSWSSYVAETTTAHEEQSKSAAKIAAKGQITEAESLYTLIQSRETSTKKATKEFATEACTATTSLATTESAYKSAFVAQSTFLVTEAQADQARQTAFSNSTKRMQDDIANVDIGNFEILSGLTRDKQKEVAEAVHAHDIGGSDGEYHTALAEIEARYNSLRTSAQSSREKKFYSLIRDRERRTVSVETARASQRLTHERVLDNQRSQSRYNFELDNARTQRLYATAVATIKRTLADEQTDAELCQLAKLAPVRKEVDEELVQTEVDLANAVALADEKYFVSVAEKRLELLSQWAGTNSSPFADYHVELATIELEAARESGKNYTSFIQSTGTNSIAIGEAKTTATLMYTSEIARILAKAAKERALATFTLDSEIVEQNNNDQLWAASAARDYTYKASDASETFGDSNTSIWTQYSDTWTSISWRARGENAIISLQLNHLLVEPTVAIQAVAEIEIAARRDKADAATEFINQIAPAYQSMADALSKARTQFVDKISNNKKNIQAAMVDAEKAFAASIADSAQQSVDAQADAKSAFDKSVVKADFEFQNADAGALLTYSKKTAEINESSAKKQLKALVALEKALAKAYLDDVKSWHDQTQTLESSYILRIAELENSDAISRYDVIEESESQVIALEKKFADESADANDKLSREMSLTKKLAKELLIEADTTRAKIEASSAKYAQKSIADLEAEMKNVVAVQDAAYNNAAAAALESYERIISETGVTFSRAVAPEHATAYHVNTSVAYEAYRDAFERETRSRVDRIVEQNVTRLTSIANAKKEWITKIAEADSSSTTEAVSAKFLSLSATLLGNYQYASLEKQSALEIAEGLSNARNAFASSTANSLKSLLVKKAILEKNLVNALNPIDKVYSVGRAQAYADYQVAISNQKASQAVAARPNNPTIADLFSVAYAQEFASFIAAYGPDTVAEAAKIADAKGIYANAVAAKELEATEQLAESIASNALKTATIASEAETKITTANGDLKQSATTLSTTGSTWLAFRDALTLGTKAETQKSYSVRLAEINAEYEVAQAKIYGLINGSAGVDGQTARNEAEAKKTIDSIAATEQWKDKLADLEETHKVDVILAEHSYYRGYSTASKVRALAQSSAEKVRRTGLATEQATLDKAFLKVDVGFQNGVAAAESVYVEGAAMAVAESTYAFYSDRAEAWAHLDDIITPNIPDEVDLRAAMAHLEQVFIGDIRADYVEYQKKLAEIDKTFVASMGTARIENGNLIIDITATEEITLADAQSKHQDSIASKTDNYFQALYAENSSDEAVISNIVKELLTAAKEHGLAEADIRYDTAEDIADKNKAYAVSLAEYTETATVDTAKATADFKIAWSNAYAAAMRALSLSNLPGASNTLTNIESQRLADNAQAATDRDRSISQAAVVRQSSMHQALQRYSDATYIAKGEQNSRINHANQSFERGMSEAAAGRVSAPVFSSKPVFEYLVGIDFHNIGNGPREYYHIEDSVQEFGIGGDPRYANFVTGMFSQMEGPDEGYISQAYTWLADAMRERFGDEFFAGLSDAGCWGVAIGLSSALVVGGVASAASAGAVSGMITGVLGSSTVLSAVATAGGLAAGGALGGAVEYGMSFAVLGAIDLADGELSMNGPTLEGLVSDVVMGAAGEIGGHFVGMAVGGAVRALRGAAADAIQSGRKIFDNYTQKFDEFGRCDNWATRLRNGGCFVPGTLVSVSSLPGYISDRCFTDDALQYTSLDSDFPELALESSSRERQQQSALWVLDEPQTSAIAIEHVPLGSRVLTKNPRPWDYDDSLPEPDHKTWLKFYITAIRGDGGIVDAEFLRPRTWIEQQNLVVGSEVPIYIDELQLDGFARVTAIEACPPIAFGEGSVVTARFTTRQVDQTVRVEIRGFDGQVDVIEGTTIHPVWSLDRSDWVPLGDLNQGERLLGQEGVAVVHSLAVQTQSTAVHNLEIHTHHVYQVGNLAILVHNAYDASSRVTPDVKTGAGYGVNDPPARIQGEWTDADFKAALRGSPPPSLGRPDLHHAGQMPGSAIHEVIPSQHRGNPALHPNKYNQGVTNQMRAQDRQLHWWYRAREAGADQLYPDLIYKK